MKALLTGDFIAEVRRLVDEQIRSDEQRTECIHELTAALPDVPMKRDNEAPRRVGRPSVGADGVQIIRAPRILLDRMKAQANREGVSASELWREAARRLLESTSAGESTPSVEPRTPQGGSD